MWIVSGNIRYYKLEEYNLDKIRPAVPLFSLYEKTGDSCYIRALHQEIKQLETHPRTKEGGYWHKKIYPHQMWLDASSWPHLLWQDMLRCLKNPAGLMRLSGKLR